MWEHSIVIPIPKKGTTKVLSDHRPVALTSLVMKAIERIIKDHITKITDLMMDLLQFAYRAGRGVDDAKIFILNTIYKHLEIPSSTARLLFADFSSGLPHQQVTDGVGELHLVRHRLHLHWLTVGLCPLPTSLHPLHR